MDKKDKSPHYLPTDTSGDEADPLQSDEETSDILEQESVDARNDKSSDPKQINQGELNHREETPVIDESIDEQTDIYYQDEAVVAIDQDVSAIDTKKAGFWVRFWAYLIDVVIVFSLNGIILSPVAFFDDVAVFQWEYISVIGIMGGIVYYLYFLFMTKGFQQTIGKMVMGIKVISSKNDRIGWSDIIFREVVGRFMHNVFFFLKLLYLVVAFTDEKQGVHDIIGNTRVVYAK